MNQDKAPSRHPETEVDSESDDDSITDLLEHVGSLNINLSLIPNISAYINSFSSFSSKDFGSINILQDLSTELKNYIASYSNMQSSTPSNEDKQTLAYSVRTAISSRLQMNKFLNDLDLGVSLNVAIERLQPVNELIKEAIFLPAEDESESDPEIEEDRVQQTEPVGIDDVEDLPAVVNDLVYPEDGNSGIPKRRKKTRFEMAHLVSEREDSTATASDNDLIDCLSSDTLKKLTHLESLEDFYDENLIRKKIKDIRDLTDIEHKTKNKLVTKLMMGNYYRYINEKLGQENKKLLNKPRKQKLTFEDSYEKSIEDITSCEDFEGSEEEYDDDTNSAHSSLISLENDGVILTDIDREPTYHDAPFNTIFGCPHYQRNCKVECPQCLRWFPCRFCHDTEIHSHKLVRNQVKHVLCMYCNTPQVPEHNYCISCEKELANYFCPTCILFDNDITKDIYHCDKCGICRLGLGIDKDFFHCDTCNICLSIDLKEKHKCLANTTHCNCSVCSEYLFTSVHKVVFMKCGHSIHQSCYEELCKHSYKCPICKKTVADVDTQFRILDQEILQSPLPLPYCFWRCIISCNDCGGKCNVPYHVLGLKCNYCKSYNTINVRLVKPEDEDEDSENEDSAVVDRADPMRLVQTNIQSNFSMDEENVSLTENEYNPTNFDDNSSEHSEIDNNLDSLVDLKSLTSSLLGTKAQSSPAKITQKGVTSILQALINNSSHD